VHDVTVNQTETAYGYRTAAIDIDIAGPITEGTINQQTIRLFVYPQREQNIVGYIKYLLVIAEVVVFGRPFDRFRCLSCLQRWCIVAKRLDGSR